MKKLKYSLTCLLIISTLSLSIQTAQAQFQEETEVSGRVVGDLLAAGITIGAAVTGSAPLIFAAGFLTKYISTYGIMGIKALVDLVKGHTPQDLGEVNLYYIYLLHVKRNLYKTMIDIRQSTQAMDQGTFLEKEIDRISKLIGGTCDIDKGCKITGLDESLVDFQFLNIALDAKSSFDVSKYLTESEIKNTYQYLMLLYLDVVIVEQKLIEAQKNVLMNQAIGTIKILKKNEYLSQAEKELQKQRVLNIVLRWVKMSDKRRKIINTAIKEPLKLLSMENEELQKEIDEYFKKYKKRGK